MIFVSHCFVMGAAVNREKDDEVEANLNYSTHLNYTRCKETRGLLSDFG